MSWTITCIKMEPNLDYNMDTWNGNLTFIKINSIIIIELE